MDAAQPAGPGATSLKAAFLLLALLVLGSIGYAFWIVLRYRGDVGV